MIKEVTVESVWKLRREVMYPDKSIDFVKLKDDNNGLHLGFYLDGELASVISVFETETELQFRKFATKESFQNKGYGSSLLSYVFDKAIADGKSKIWCNARKSATGLYERFGMHSTGDCWWKDEIEFIKMEKDLRH
jgi:phosphoribosylformimino-5-aminoimidazole carboxamide ribotide isomerase